MDRCSEGVTPMVGGGVVAEYAIMRGIRKNRVIEQNSCYPFDFMNGIHCAIDLVPDEDIKKEKK